MLLDFLKPLDFRRELLGRSRDERREGGVDLLQFALPRLEIRAGVARCEELPFGIDPLSGGRGVRRAEVLFGAVLQFALEHLMPHDVRSGRRPFVAR
jgi:hypothetical protein